MVGLDAGPAMGGVETIPAMGGFYKKHTTFDEVVQSLDYAQTLLTLSNTQKKFGFFLLIFICFIFCDCFICCDCFFLGGLLFFR
jgi:hypothetical protein